MAVINNAQAPVKIKHRLEFRTSSRPVDGNAPWSGRKGGADSLGYLPSEYHADAQSALYVVYSYATPIGWINMHGHPVVPDIGYSLTTGQQQMATRTAWGMPNRFPARGRQTVKIPGPRGRSGGF